MGYSPQGYKESDVTKATEYTHNAYKSPKLDAVSQRSKAVYNPSLQWWKLKFTESKQLAQDCA